ncbi:NADP-dependent oxidoreductase [Paenibacillus agricola]|uniref:NADP-dependent oxidoreductase n=1 Tax=Paenibacillus agricola TaxID=2716264 RepID=A0ABX0JDM1_9BACL|nr:NADP-dependent oxidoreductase [Paenibacillus agricola]NHN34043.1 NADP-dependent oxidoreductase [Paenibacillus agricola]
MPANKVIKLVSRPKEMPTLDNFSIEEAQIPSPAQGEVLLRTLYISVDPYMRGRMNDAKSYAPPFALNEAIAGGVISEVVESYAEGFQKGDVVLGNSTWTLYSVAKPERLTVIDPNIAPITTALGVLGMPGLTAYFGLLDIGQPKEGETVVVSGAAGAVGMIVGQIAKIKGARVVGIAGSDEKNEYLIKELGFDAAINYKTTADLHAELAQACPDGIDVYFDNVGGAISDAALSLINKNARIPICGQIALYNLGKADVGNRIQSVLLVNTALMQGFLVGQYAARFPEAVSQLAQWLQQKKLKYAENIVDGFEQTPHAFIGLFTGDNLGKQLVKVAEPSNK